MPGGPWPGGWNRHEAEAQLFYAKKKAREPARVPSPYKLGDSVRGGVYRPPVHRVGARGQRGVTGAATRGACARALGAALPRAAAADTARGLWFLPPGRSDSDRCAGLWLVLFYEPTGHRGTDPTVVG